MREEGYWPVQRYLPTDDWPIHPKSWFQDVFKEARARGWSLEAYSNHNNYLLVCPGHECQFQVFSTGVGGESAAKTIGKRVKRCLHGQQHLVDSLARATELLDSAQRLLDAVGTLRERDRANARADTLLGNEDFNEDDVEELLAQADELAREARDLLGALADSEARDVMAMAGDDLTEARGLLHPLPPENTDVKVQRKRLGELLDRRRKLADPTDIR